MWSHSLSEFNVLLKCPACRRTLELSPRSPQQSRSNSCDEEKTPTRSQDIGAKTKKYIYKNSHVMADNNKDNKALTGIFFVFYY